MNGITNISPFLNWCPNGNPADFSAERASGSTSQAANVMEAVDCGAKLLLIDEDRSATNFMIRDHVMKTLIPQDPITPFTERVNELYQRLGVSTILVVGGSGEYFPVADEIYMVENYHIHDVTEKYKGFCGSHDGKVTPYADWKQSKVFYSDGFTARPDGEYQEKLKVLNDEYIRIGDEKIDIRGLHNLVSPYQINALGFILRYLEGQCKDEKLDLAHAIDSLYLQMERDGLDFLYSSYFTSCDRFLDCPRKQEVFAVIQRMRKVRVDGGKNG